ncbi:MAG: F0F1 ATP synthase subunit B [Chloroflexota bacterium]|nr:F0F1 ATP synthase subunit B [Chloroflexota bacterium]
MEALGINLPGLLTHIISFLVLLIVLRLTLYKPIVNMLDQRSQRIRESLEAVERAQQESAASQEEVAAQLEAARAEGQQLIASAREVADRFREEETAKVRQEIEAERSRAEANIQRERDAAIEQLRSEFAGLAITAAERVVERSLDEQAHQDIIDRVLEESGSRINSN